MTELLIKHQCQQCGAPVTLTETDHLITCGHCRVPAYLLPQRFYRLMLPHKAPLGRDLVYVPYWRYKGMLFFVTDNGLQHRFMDATRLAVNINGLPSSLGVRSQAMTLQFVTEDAPGHFIKPDVPFQDVLHLFDRQMHIGRTGHLIHQCDIGESVSLIYAPYYAEDRLMDAILNHPLEAPDLADTVPALPGGPPTWQIRFIPTLCPNCGWDLHGHRDSITLVCRNCDSVWRPDSSRLRATRYACIPAPHDNCLYLPFWRFQAEVDGVTLNSYADLIRAANLPRVAQPGDDTREFFFWSLAFKVRPRTFLRVGCEVNLHQPQIDESKIMLRGRTHPVNLPVSEALESLTINLAGILKPRKAMLRLLPHITISPQRAILVFLPFQEGHHEYTNEDMKVSINKNQLSLASNL